MKAQGAAEKRALVTQLLTYQAELKDNLVATLRPSQLDLLEIGCPEDSSLGQAMEKEGGTAYRMGIWNKYDFSRASTVSKAKAFIDEKRPRRVHLSPPCTPFSILQALNQKSDEQTANLKKKIAWGTKVMNNMIEVGLHALRQNCEISLEQPANATSWRSVQSLMNLRKQLYEVTTAGCAWGMRDSETGQAVYKNWRFLVSNQRAAEALEKKCPRDHAHHQLEGTRRVAESAKYPEALCRALSREVLAHTLVTGIAAGVSEIEGVMEELAACYVEEAEALTIEKVDEKDDPPDELRKSVRLKLHRLHAQLGHPGTRAFTEFLRRRQAPRWVQREAEELKCAACERFQKQPMHPTASGRLADPLDVLVMDGFDWVHPLNGTRARGSLLVDEGSAKTVVRVHATQRDGGGCGNTNADEAWDTFVRWWAQYFGRPLRIRSDPAGEYEAHVNKERAAHHDIQWESEPGGAHWRTGKVESVIMLVKNTATKLAYLDPTCGIDELFMWAAAAHNEMPNSSGFSPDQIVLGRRMRPLDSELMGSVVPLQEEARSGSAAEEAMRRRLLARTAYAESLADRQARLTAVKRARAQQEYTVGDQVHVWRQAGKTDKDKNKTSKGGFVGPATVLAHLRQPLEEGRLRNVVILAFRGQVLRAAPQQLRLVSDAERTMIEVDSETRDLLHQRTDQALKKLSRVVDITQEGEPDCDQLDEPANVDESPVEMSVDPEPGPPSDEAAPGEPEPPLPGPPRGPEPAPEQPGGEPSPEGGPRSPPREPETELLPSPRGEGRGTEESGGDGGAPPQPARAYDPRDDLPFSIRQRLRAMRRPREEAAQADGPALKKSREGPELEAALAAASDEASAYEVHIDLPDKATDKKAWRRFTRDPTAYAAAAVKKSGPKVILRKLDPAMREQFRAAKNAEVNSWLANQVTAAARRSDAGPKGPMRMRWHLTVKSDGQAKARIVLLGFEDPRLGHMQTASPTASVRARNLAYQVCANAGLRIHKGDVKAAFLQSQSSNTGIFVEPVRELREAMDLREDEVVLMLKKAYGLCDAPKEWYDEVARRMTESGWVAMKLEPCVWTLYDKGRLVAIAFVHVDDFVVGIKEDNDKAKQKHEELRNHWQWGSWETGCFRQTGVDVVQLADHSISLSFAAAAAKVEMIEGWSGRPGRADDALPAPGITACRAAIGGLQYLASQGQSLIAADTSILASYTNTATHGLVTRINKVIRTAHETARVPVRFRAVKDPIFIAFHDAAWAVRKDGKSQGGYIIGMGERALLQGESHAISPLQFTSRKLPRVTRSSLGCEVQSGNMCHEDLTYMRMAWTELMDGFVNLKDVRGTLRMTQATMVTDCKGLYDALARSVSAGLGADDRRSAIEALGLQQSMEEGATELRWVHSEAMPADGLTKGSCAARSVLADFLTRGYWRLVQDPSFTSAKKRRLQGREDILDDGIEREPFFPSPDCAEDLDDYEMPVGYIGFDDGWQYDSFDDLPV